jgi:DNA-binding transcriptional regulator YiaG
MEKSGKRSRGSRALMQSLADLEAIVRQGLSMQQIKDRFPARQRVSPPSPGEYSPAEIRSLRARIRVSQSEFAELVGVSRILVQGWEQGVRDPSPLARRLLDTIARDPAAWLAGLRHQASTPRRRVG